MNADNEFFKYGDFEWKEFPPEHKFTNLPRFEAHPLGQGKWAIETHRKDVNNIYQKIRTHILDLKEKTIRDILIKEGWTPPTTNNKNKK